MYLRRTVLPTAEPISLEKAMKHCRVDGFGESPAHPDEGLISDLIPAARERAEEFTGLCLAPSTWEYRVDSLDDRIRIPMQPITSITSVEYVDTDGNVQTLSTSLYVADIHRRPPEIRRGWNVIYPTVRNEPGCVRITFEAGPTDGESPNPYPLPRPIYQAMMLIIGHLYEHREDVVVGTIATEIPLGAQALMRPLRVKIL